jgi:hypothetical protein
MHLTLALVAMLCAAGPTDDPEAAARLEFMKKSAAVYTIALDDKKKTELKLVPDPALRWNNPVSNVPDGVLFLWLGQDGRPELAAQVFIAAGTKDLWLHEFQSLALSPLKITRGGKESRWRPGKPGVEFHPVPDGPAVATTPVQRLAQMKAIAEGFSASDDFEGKSRWELRLLPKPLARYGKPKTEVTDGALFVFAHGTDPEVFLMVEAREVNGELKWHYALAGMTAYALKASHKGKEVWARPEQKAPFPPEKPYFILRYEP